MSTVIFDGDVDGDRPEPGRTAGGRSWTGAPIPSGPMSPLAGPFLAATVVLALAGVAKVTDPVGTRVALRTVGLPSTPLVARIIGLGEIAVAAAVLAVGGVLPAVAVSAAYVGFAAFAEVLRRRSRGRADCGCFGRASAPASRIHVYVNLVLAAVALSTLVDPVPHLGDALALTPWSGIPLLLLIAIMSWQVVVVLTVLPRVQAEARRVPPRRTLAEVVR